MAAQSTTISYETFSVGALAKMIDYSIVQTGDTQIEYRKKTTPLSRRAWTVSWKAVIDADDVPDVEEMFETFGTHTSFLLWPPRLRDRRETTQQDLQNTVTLGVVGDGSTATFQLQITRTVGSISGSKKVMHPKSGTVLVYVNAVLKTETTHYTINYSTGVVTFTGGNIPTAGQSVKATFDYNTPVRFLSEEIETTIEIDTATNTQEELNSTALIEVFDE